MNACFACEKQLTEDVAIKGHYLCSNQRCIRFGLVTTVYLAPPTPEDPPKMAAQDPEVNKDLATPEEIAIKEAEALKQDGADLPKD